MNRLVIITFAIFILLLGVFMVYKNLPGKAGCPEFDVAVSTSEPFVGEPVTFTDKTPEVRKRKWDFGDKSKPVKAQETQHVYEEAGKYILKLTVNGNCIWKDTIDVVEKEIVGVEFKGGVIEAPVSAKVGESVTFKANLPAEATDITWKFDESMDVPKGLEVKHAFTNSMDYTVKLYWEEGDRRYESDHKINIVPDSGGGCPNISEIAFRNMLNNVQATSWGDFSKYFSGNNEVKTEVNNSSSILFYDYWQNLRNETDVTVNSVQLKKNSSNCITKIRINQTK